MTEQEVLLQEMEERIKYVKGFITAFNVNIDAIIPLRTTEIRELLDILTLDQKSILLSSLNNPPLEIHSPVELLAGILYSLCNEKTIELGISSSETHNWIKTRFQPSLLRIGGQAGNMAYQLSRIGVKKIYISIPSLTLLQAKTFSNLPNILTPVRSSENNIEFKHPLDAVHHDKEDLIHWVFEINPWESLDLNSKKCESKSRVRLIATYDEQNSRLEFKEEFKIGSLKIAGQVDYAIASGYHLLKRRYPDRSCPEDHILKTIDLIESWKRINSGLKVHYEHGFNGDLQILRLIFDNVRKAVDSLGLNEVELPFILRAYGFEEESKHIWNEFDIISLFEGIRELYDLLNIGHIVLHTKEFSMSLMSDIYGVDPDSEVKGLLFGNFVAATAAMSGDFPTIQEVKSTIQNLETSNEGVKHMYKLMEYLKTKYAGHVNTFKNSMVVDLHDSLLSFAVAKNVSFPKITVGLGDAFTAALLAVEASSKRYELMK